MINHPNRSKKAKAAASSAIETASEVTVMSIKGFDQNLSCRGFKFEIGKTYTHTGKVEKCEAGFHACEHPLDVLRYYPPAMSRYAVVTQSGTMSRDDSDTKIASAKITIEAEIQLPQLIERAVKWVFDRAKWSEGPVATGPNEGVTASGDRGAATASGDRGAATASGDRGAATASGLSGAATASGDNGAATASGDRGAATASGYRGAATASGLSGAATASGLSGKARGVDGCALFLVYRDPDNWNILHAWAGIVGRDSIKPMTWYSLDADGRPFEIGGAA
jgi:hypothetical protein